MVEVGKLSATKLTTYKGCNLAYFLKYVAHEKVPINMRAAFGKEIHYMLELFYKKNFKCADSFAKLFKFRWISFISGDFLRGNEKKELIITPYTYFSKNKDTGARERKILRVGNHINLNFSNDILGVIFGYMNLGTGILSRFYDRHKQKQVPEKFEMNFGKKKEESFKINGHLVTGVFDRIDRMAEDWFITDYKTDKSSPERDSFILHRNPQFTLYSYAFREIFGVNEKAILYYHLRTGNVFKTHRNEKDFDYLKKLLDEVSESIRADNFTPFYGFHCNFCDYRVPCEKYSIYHGGPKITLESKIICAEKFTLWDSDVSDWMHETEER